MQTNRWSIQDLTRMALLAALLCASAYIAFPIPITLVNVTAQTFVLNLVALLLTKEQAGVTVALWILLGAVGVPGVFRRTWGLQRTGRSHPAGSSWASSSPPGSSPG